MTNFEKIKDCTDEELAYLISRKVEESCPSGKKYNTKTCMPAVRHCEPCWLAWLQAEANQKEWDDFFEHDPWKTDFLEYYE